MSVPLACDGTNESAGRGPLSAADGGPDSSANAGPDAGSAGRGAGGATAKASEDSAGGLASGGRISATGGSAATDGQACVPQLQGCERDTPCCSGYCTAIVVGADGAPAGWQALCQKPGCARFGERCVTTS